MTKYNVGDKVRILDVDGIMFGCDWWRSGDITEVMETHADGDVRLKITRGNYVGQPFIVSARELRYIEKVDDKTTKNQRITELEAKVAELEAKFEALREALQ